MKTEIYDAAVIPVVVVIKDNVVNQITVCEDAKHAETLFIESCKGDPTFDGLTSEEIDDVLSDGYFEFSHDYSDGSVCLSWADKLKIEP